VQLQKALSAELNAKAKALAVQRSRLELNDTLEVRLRAHLALKRLPE
tara:strand:+ start:161 stop:301 length:141 start_codon:yes stop_codon:yes gene_type:complete